MWSLAPIVALTPCPNKTWRYLPERFRNLPPAVLLRPPPTSVSHSLMEFPTLSLPSRIPEVLTPPTCTTLLSMLLTSSSRLIVKIKIIMADLF
ncbi:MAG: hypothetical protein [Microviridae sp.]|nr:MAG: hypothetical protein [Microviridae sp.]